MRAIVESTDAFVTVDGVKGRLWQGATEAGVPFSMVVVRTAVRSDRDAAEFDRDLQEVAKPRRETCEAFDIRFFVD